MVSHLICGGVYDQSTGLIYKGGRYFDPHLGLWLALTPLMVVGTWRGPCRGQRWAACGSGRMTGAMCVTRASTRRLGSRQPLQAGHGQARQSYNNVIYVLRITFYDQDVKHNA